LIRGIADDDIKVHRKQVIRIVGVDEFVSVAFQSLLSCLFSIGGLRGAAKDAFAALPSMCDVFVADVALGIVKTNDGVRPIGVFGAVHSAAGEEGRQLRNGDAEELISENVFQALLPIWEVSFQPLVEPFGNLPQKDATLAAGVQKGNGRVGKKLLREQIQHGVGNLRRREHLVTGKIGQTAQYVRVMDVIVHDSASGSLR
jgi:hypothetical protein